MIARCDTCGRAFLEIDCRRQAPPARCVTCALDELTAGEVDSIATAGEALRVLAAVPASWVHRRRVQHR
jgi:hypothetical protein